MIKHQLNTESTEGASFGHEYMQREATEPGPSGDRTGSALLLQVICEYLGREVTRKLGLSVCNERFDLLGSVRCLVQAIAASLDHLLFAEDGAFNWHQGMQITKLDNSRASRC